MLGLSSGETLTSREYRVIDEPLNVADAHARYAPTQRMLSEVIPRFGLSFIEATRVGQREADRRGFEAFMKLSGQSQVVASNLKVIPVYSSSVALEIVANAIGSAHALVQMPTFDNIPAILSRNSVEPQPYDFGQGPPPSGLFPGAPVVLVSPNNPTGEFLTADEFSATARSCRVDSRLLVLDASFRLFEPRACFDHIAILENEGCSFVVIEDTGKVWPTTDLKLAYVVTSAETEPAIVSVADDVLLNVSPFISLLIEMLATGSGYLEEVRGLIAANRQFLRSALSDLALRDIVTIPHPESMASVELVQVRRNRVDAGRAPLLDEFERAGVAVLPTESFWWSLEDGTSPPTVVACDEFRFALSRDQRPFADAVTRACEVLANRFPFCDE